MIGSFVAIMVILYRQQINIWHQLQYDFKLPQAQKIDIRYELSDTGWRSFHIYLPVNAELYILSKVIVITTKPKSLYSFNLVTNLPVILTKQKSGAAGQTSFWRIVTPVKTEAYGKKSITIEYFDPIQTKRKFRITLRALQESEADKLKEIVSMLT